MLWSYTAVSDIFTVRSVADINQDGKDDVIAGGYGDVVNCIDDANGNLLWQYNTGSTVWTLAGIADVDGDGIRDVLVGTGSQ